MPAQVTAADIARWSGAMDDHTLAAVVMSESGSMRLDGLPALSGDGASVAVLQIESGAGGDEEIRILRVANGETLNTLRLSPGPDDGVSGLEAQRAFDEGVASEANAYLRNGKFRPMAVLYQLPDRKEAGEDGVWAYVNGRWRIEFDIGTEVLALTETESGRTRLSMQRPWRVYGYIKQADALCAVRGLPYEGWIDDASGAVVFRVINDLFGHHYCSPPDDWIVHALDETSVVIDVPRPVVLPLTTELMVQAPGEALHPVSDAAMRVRVGEALRLEASAPEGVESIHFWSLVKRPPRSGVLVFDEISPRENSRRVWFMADRAGDYLIEVYVTTGEHRSEPTRLRIQAEGTLTASAAIGPEGGAVALPDGAAVLVPPGALTETIHIAIALLPVGDGLEAPQGAAGPIYDITPDDQAFRKAVQIIAPFDPDGIEPGTLPSDVGVGRRGADGALGRVGVYDGHRDGCCMEIDAKRRLVTFFVWVF